MNAGAYRPAWFATNATAVCARHLELQNLVTLWQRANDVIGIQSVGYGGERESMEVDPRGHRESWTPTSARIPAVETSVKYNRPTRDTLVSDYAQKRAMEWYFKSAHGMARRNDYFYSAPPGSFTTPQFACVHALIARTVVRHSTEGHYALCTLVNLARVSYVVLRDKLSCLRQSYEQRRYWA